MNSLSLSKEDRKPQLFGGRPLKSIVIDTTREPSSTEKKRASRLGALKKMQGLHRNSSFYNKKSHVTSSSPPNNLSPWNEEVTLAAATEFGNGLSVSTNEFVTPLPSNLSRVAAKRLGIDIAPVDIPRTSTTSRGSSPKGRRRSSTSPASEPRSFFTTESDDEGKKRSSSGYSTRSSRTSYDSSHQNESGTDDTWDMQEHQVTTMDQVSSPQTIRPSKEAETLDDSRPSTATQIHAVYAAKPLPALPDTSICDTTTSQSSEREASNSFEDMISSMAEAIHNHIKETADQTIMPPTYPTVPKRSSRRNMMNGRSLESTFSAITRPDPSLTLPSEPRRPSTAHPALRINTSTTPIAAPIIETESFPNNAQADNQAIAPDAAEMVILNIYSNFSDLHDLYAAARVNRGFYSVFKRHELSLLKQTVFNGSPLAWELLEASTRKGVSVVSKRRNSRQSAPRYLHSLKRNVDIIASLKSLILTHCQHRLQPEMIALLRDATSKRVDNALMRIWTFSSTFGGSTGREHDLNSQIDWLKGISASTAVHFARGNEGGVSVDELNDIMEMWGCIKDLLHGITGQDRFTQAQKYGVFNAAHLEPNDTESAQKVLDEWYHHVCTFGLDLVLELATVSSSRTSRVFQTARDMGITTWTLRSDGSSRSSFLGAVIKQVLSQQIEATQAPSTKESTPTEPTTETSIISPLTDNKSISDPVISPIPNMTSPQQSLLSPVTHWLQYIPGPDDEAPSMSANFALAPVAYPFPAVLTTSDTELQLTPIELPVPTTTATAEPTILSPTKFECKTQRQLRNKLVRRSSSLNDLPSPKPASPLGVPSLVTDLPIYLVEESCPNLVSRFNKLYAMDSVMLQTKLSAPNLGLFR